MTSVRGSSSQYCRRSLLLMSALFPNETKLEMPMPARVAALSTAMPTAPDCDANATRPAVGRIAPNVASTAYAGSVLTTPTQFGPIRRMP